VGLLAIIGVAGMAIDSSHAFVNVTRVQNAVDAAALSAAKTLHLFGKDTALATAHGNETFTDHLEGELGDDLEIAFTYSDTLSPFAAGGADPNYVRATVAALDIDIWFARVLPGVDDTFSIGATAVSGPLPLGGGQVCDIAPLLVCAPDTTDTDASDGTLYGMTIGDDAPVSCLKQNSHDGGNGNGNGNGNGGNAEPTTCAEDAGDPTLESGNFYLSRVNCPGGKCVRDALAGAYEGCADLSGSIETEPGNTVGPTRQGLNTRFNLYQGGGVSPTEYPPDLVTGSMLYPAYKQAYAAEAWDNTIGEEQRRVMAVPIADCAGLQNGQSSAPLLGLGCYFLTQPVPAPGGQGGGGNNSYILGQLIDRCEASGRPGNTNGPANENGPYKIVLLDDPDSEGS